MSPEDQEFEVARRFVRLAGDAVRQAATTPAGSSPQAVAQAAIMAAAQRHAPGLLGQATTGGTNGAGAAGASGQRRTGRWVRRGKGIYLLGI
jgi:hypothetical protein